MARLAAKGTPRHNHCALTGGSIHAGISLSKRAWESCYQSHKCVWMRSEARDAGGRDTQAAVVHDPLRITKQGGSGLAFDLSDESFALR